MSIRAATRPSTSIVRPALRWSRGVDPDDNDAIVVEDRAHNRYLKLPIDAGPLLELADGSASLEDYRRALGATEGLTCEESDHLIRRFQSDGILADDRTAEALRADLLRRRSRMRADALDRILREVAPRLPLYRDRVGAAGAEGTVTERLSRLPVLTRGDLRRAFPAAVLPEEVRLADELAAGRVVLTTSSGTQGEQLEFISGAAHRRARWYTCTWINRAIWEHRGDQAAVLAPARCAPGFCLRQQPQRDQRTAAETLQLVPPDDPGAVRPDEARNILGEIAAHGTKVLLADPEYLVRLAWAARDHALQIPALAVVVSSFERLSLHARRTIAATFGPVYDWFTASEVGELAIECCAGQLHLNDLYYVAEVLDDNGLPAAPGAVGRLVVTTLRDTIAPLLRYDTGDLVRRPRAGDESCACGELSPVLGLVEGRARDCLVDTAGRRVTPRQVDEALAGADGLRAWQVRQQPSGALVARIVPAPDAGSRLAADVVERLRSTFAAGNGVEVDVVRAIYPELSGKFRATVREQS